MLLVPFFLLPDPKIRALRGLWARYRKVTGIWVHAGLQEPCTGSYCMYLVLGLVIGQDIWQRMFTARTPKIARRGTITAGVYAIFYSLAAIMLGMSVYAAGIKLSDPSMAFEAGISAFLPQGVVGLLLAVALAASMSVASGTILACSTVVYDDLYVRFIRRGPSEEISHDSQNQANSSKDAWINRGIALVVGLVTIDVSLAIGDLFKALDLAYAFL
ncbi:sodium:solute symporter family transporter [Bifidobacterium actinocoloniiforme]|nr:hypothetical protein [Bifidobacterium actinocoloniiforme]